MPKFIHLRLDLPKKLLLLGPDVRYPSYPRCSHTTSFKLHAIKFNLFFVPAFPSSIQAPLTLSLELAWHFFSGVFLLRFLVLGA